MGLAHSPRIVTNGLIFAYDSDNIKSYKGPAIQNMATSITATGISIAGESWASGSETVNIPTVGTLTAQTITGYNNYSVSGDCCPSLFYYGIPISCQPSTLYTYSLLYKSTLGYSHPNFMYRYEWTAGNAYITEGGVHNDSNRIHLGDGWYWAWGTFTTSATTAYLHVRFFHYNYTTAIEKIYVAKVLVTPGNFTGLHPSRWPDVNTTRANTATVYNISGQNIQMTANSLTYASNGSYSFNGTSDNITTNFVPNKDEGTVVAWIRINNLKNYNTIFDNSLSADDWEFWVYVDGLLSFRTSNGNIDIRLDSNGTYLSAGVWYQVCVTWSLTEGRLYVNGIEVASDTTTGSRTTPSVMTIGGLLNTKFDGRIPILYSYNRALTAAEVKQNFNALRGRFGL